MSLSLYVICFSQTCCFSFFGATVLPLLALVEAHESQFVQSLLFSVLSWMPRNDGNWKMIFPVSGCEDALGELAQKKRKAIWWEGSDMNSIAVLNLLQEEPCDPERLLHLCSRSSVHSIHQKWQGKKIHIYANAGLLVFFCQHDWVAIRSW